MDPRSTVLEAALRLLREEGPVALRVRRVAEAAGCSTMGVYTYFGGKDGLVEALWLEGFRSLTETLEGVTGGEGPIAHLWLLAQTYRAWALEHPTHYQLMFARSVPEYEPSPDALAEGLRGFAILVDAVVDAQAAGAFRPGDPTPAAIGIWGLSHGLVMIELGGNACGVLGQDPAAVYRDAVETMLCGFGSSGSGLSPEIPVSRGRPRTD